MSVCVSSNFFFKPLLQFSSDSSQFSRNLAHVIYVPISKNCGTYFRNCDLIFWRLFFNFTLGLSQQRSVTSRGDVIGRQRWRTPCHACAPQLSDWQLQSGTHLFTSHDLNLISCHRLRTDRQRSVVASLIGSQSHSPSDDRQ